MHDICSEIFVAYRPRSLRGSDPENRVFPVRMPQENGDGGERETLLVEYPAPPPKGEGLLPASESPLRRLKCETFSAPLNKCGDSRVQ